MSAEVGGEIEPIVERLETRCRELQDGVAKRQRILAAEEQALVNFAAEGGRQLEVDAELADLADAVAQSTRPTGS